MKTYRINSLNNWLKQEIKLREHRYEPWQWQYRWNLPEGSHIIFTNLKDEDIEIITYNEEVHNAILNYKK